jgi:glucose-6-phosphate 1-dehydrogenase
VMPILNAWKKSPGKQLEFYPAGSWGPAAADRLLKPYAKEWYKLETRPKVLQNMASIE